MKTLNTLKTLFITIASFYSCYSFAQQQEVSIGLEIDSAHSVLFGVPLDSNGYRMVWHPQKASLLVGSPFAPEIWHIDSIGENSFSFGTGNAPYGIQSMTWGLGNSIGRNTLNATAFGFLNQVHTGADYSLVGGRENVTHGGNSVVMGSNNLVREGASNALCFGSSNDINSSHGTAWGELNKTSGLFATAVGRLNQAKGFVSNTFGTGLISKGANSMVVGIANDTTLQFTNDQSNTTAGTPLFVVGNGSDFNNRSNALSVFASGFVKIGSDTAVADLHIKQSVHSNDVSSAGIRLENSFDNGYWQIYSSGDFLNFGKFGTSLAFIDSDGNYVDNAMLFHEGDIGLPIAKSFKKDNLNKISLKESISKKGGSKLKVDPVSLEKYMPDLVKYDAEGKPSHLDQNQLILHLLASVQEHEKLIDHQSKLLLEQQKLLKEIMDKD